MGVRQRIQPSETTSRVDVLAEFDDGSGLDLLVGGRFETAGRIPSGNRARLRGCELTGELFCFGDGSGTPCPCGNASSSSERAGCLNSLLYAGTLLARGRPKLSDDSLALEGVGMPDSAALYFEGTERVAGGAGAVFGDGLVCVAGTVRRLGSKSNVNGASRFPESTDLPISSLGGVLFVSTRSYQVWYRNAATYCGDATFNLTNGVEIDWEL